MARIAGFHPAGPGSIPGVGELIFKKLFSSIDFFLKSNQFDLFIFYISIKLYELLNMST